MQTQELKLSARYLIVAWLCLLSCISQAADSGSKFQGCYEVKSLTWMPPDDSIKFIPKQFELTDKPWASSKNVFRITSLDSNTDWFTQRLWTWTANNDSIRLSFSTGFGGFEGTLHRRRSGELAGKLKEFCDSRCGWDKRVGKIRIDQIACPSAT